MTIKIQAGSLWTTSRNGSIPVYDDYDTFVDTVEYGDVVTVLADDGLSAFVLLRGRPVYMSSVWFSTHAMAVRMTRIET